MSKFSGDKLDLLTDAAKFRCRQTWKQSPKLFYIMNTSEFLRFLWKNPPNKMTNEARPQHNLTCKPNLKKVPKLAFSEIVRTVQRKSQKNEHNSLTSSFFRRRWSLTSRNQSASLASMTLKYLFNFSTQPWRSMTKTPASYNGEFPPPSMNWKIITLYWTETKGMKSSGTHRPEIARVLQAWLGFGHLASSVRKIGIFEDVNNLGRNWGENHGFRRIAKVLSGRDLTWRLGDWVLVQRHQIVFFNKAKHDK